MFNLSIKYKSNKLLYFNFDTLYYSYSYDLIYFGEYFNSIQLLKKCLKIGYTNKEKFVKNDRIFFNLILL